MKRKKWTEEEEETLIRSYSSLLSSTSSLLLQCSRRQKKLQQVADRVNSLHHRLRPSSFPFLRSWRDVSVKIHNMRHRYLHAKNRAHGSFSSGEEEEAALSLWPNFLLYRQVFGDVDVGDGEDEEEEESLAKLRRRRMKKKRRTEEKREEEEMEWMERMIAAQAEHERRVVQAHADACRAQLQVLGALVRVVCQLVRPASSGDDPPQQQRRRDEDGKDGPVGGAAGYL